MDPNTTTSLTSGVIDLKKTSGNVLNFESKHEINWFDRVTVQVTAVAEGQEEDWVTVAVPARRPDVLTDWTLHRVDLSQFDGQDVKVRFQVEASETADAVDGFYVDNLMILGDSVSPEAR